MNSGLPDFSFEEPDLGEVLICWDIAKKQAIEYKTTIKEELERLTVHGVLHLFGYDHEIGPSEEKKMFTLQDKILKTL
jgi:probable rRNA maturation factor